jgi:peptide/nickel transport system permease protein
MTCATQPRTSGALDHLDYVLRESPVTALSFAMFAFFILSALIGPWVVPYDPLASSPGHAAAAFGTPLVRHRLARP